MDRWVAGAQRLVAVVIVAATTVALAQSYRGLVDWSLAHRVPAPWAQAWPLMVDSFLVVGELRLFIAAHKGAAWRVRVWAWCVTLGGLAVSVGGNVGHLGQADWQSRATAAVPPLAAAVALGIGLGLVKAAAAAPVNHRAAPDCLCVTAPRPRRRCPIRPQAIPRTSQSGRISASPPWRSWWPLS